MFLMEKNPKPARDASRIKAPTTNAAADTTNAAEPKNDASGANNAAKANKTSIVESARTDESNTVDPKPPPGFIRIRPQRGDPISDFGQSGKPSTAKI